MSHRTFQYSLRTLLLLVTLCCAACGWLGVKLQQAREQRAALVALDLDTHGMYYAHQHEGQKVSASPPGPAWLRSTLGEDLFCRVDWVLLNGSKLSESQWQQLEKLDTIRVLYLCDAHIRDTDLAHLQSFNSLEKLDMAWNPLTDEGLVHLRRLTALRELDLWDTGVTAEGVENLQRSLPNCEITFGQARRE